MKHALVLLIGASALLCVACDGELDYERVAPGEAPEPERPDPSEANKMEAPEQPSSNNSTPEPDPEVVAQVASIELSASVTTLTEGQGGLLFVVLRDDSGGELELTPLEWSSSSPEVATAEGTGIVRALAPGKTQLTASLGEISSAPIELTVLPAPERGSSSVRVEPARVALAPGDALALSARVRFGGRDLIEVSELEWSSSDAAIADVDEHGRLSAIAEGVATVWAEYDGARSVEVPVVVTAQPDWAAVDLVSPSDHVVVDATLSLEVGFRMYRTGANPGFGLPFLASQVEVVRQGEVLGVLTPSFGVASGEVDVSGLPAGDHEIFVRAQTPEGESIQSATITITRQGSVMDAWEDFAPDELVYGQYGAVYARQDGLYLVTNYCARECGVLSYKFDSERSRWSRIEYVREEHREANGAIETRTRDNAWNIDLPRYVGWGWPSADARHMDAPGVAQERLVVTYSNHEAHTSFNEEDAPERYWFDCHVATWSPSAGLDGQGGWELLSDEAPDFLYKLPHPSTFDGGPQRHPNGVDQVRAEDCLHPQLAVDPSGNHTIAYVGGPVPGDQRRVYMRRWDGAKFVDSARPLELVGSEPVLHDMILDSTGSPVVIVDQMGTRATYRLGADDTWQQMSAAQPRGMRTLHALQNAGVLAGAVQGGDAAVYLGSGLDFTRLGPSLDVHPWAHVTSLDITEHQGTYVAVWAEGPERGNSNIYAAVFDPGKAAWELIGGGALDLHVDEHATEPRAMIDARGHLIVNYTALNRAEDLGRYTEHTYIQRVRRTREPVTATRQ